MEQPTKNVRTDAGIGPLPYSTDPLPIEEPWYDALADEVARKYPKILQRLAPPPPKPSLLARIARWLGW